MNTVATVTALLTALAAVLGNAAVLWVVVRPIRRRQSEIHEVVKAVANGQAARVDQLEQVVQEAGVPIPPAPPIEQKVA